MRQKLITLDPTSWELASKKKNFSEWVRLQLRIEGEWVGLEAMEREILDLAKQNEYWYQKCRQYQRELQGRISE